MQNFLFFVILLLGFNLSAQTVYPTSKSLTFNDGTHLYTQSTLYTYQDFVLFSEGNVFFKIHKDSIKTIHENTKAIKSDKISYYLYKFASESQTGIGLQVLGTALGVGLSFANVSPIVYLTLPPAISLTGFIIWASSYRHLKKFHLISESKDYFTTP